MELTEYVAARRLARVAAAAVVVLVLGTVALRTTDTDSTVEDPAGDRTPPARAGSPDAAHAAAAKLVSWLRGELGRPPMLADEIHLRMAGDTYSTFNAISMSEMAWPRHVLADSAAVIVDHSGTDCLGDPPRSDLGLALGVRIAVGAAVADCSLPAVHVWTDRIGGTAVVDLVPHQDAVASAEGEPDAVTAGVDLAEELIDFVNGGATPRFDDNPLFRISWEDYTSYPVHELELFEHEVGISDPGLWPRELFADPTVTVIEARETDCDPGEPRADRRIRFSARIAAGNAVADCSAPAVHVWLHADHDLIALVDLAAHRPAALTPEHRRIADAFIRFAVDGSPMAWADEVELRLGNRPLATLRGADRNNRAAWRLSQDHYAGLVGPFSAVEAIEQHAEGPPARVEEPGGFTFYAERPDRCLAFAAPLPAVASGRATVSVELTGTTCHGFTVVDLYLDAGGRVEAVDLRIGSF